MLIRTGRNKSQDCSKRGLVYETYCITCKERETERLESSCGEDKTKLREELERVKLHKYIGESSRSAFERGFEHINDIKQLKPSSHMLRHVLDQHEGESITSIEFGMETVRFTRTSFERQILESVTIQQNTDHFLLNSRSEYNRCSLPRLSTKLGDSDYKRYEKELEEAKKKEEEIEGRIREMRKKRNQLRRPRVTQWWGRG